MQPQQNEMANGVCLWKVEGKKVRFDDKGKKCTRLTYLAILK